ncbi:hypothetical protein [Lentiprolixibacter aurantiacus]|uniref:Uncharacterized protein n=1 Tax=Lentiprolixibacter aurantiacus TaxID=2993939 RepID=A0AAE3SMD2_9FLAO|nr:hypothetical protein [Lentiprolixibacter aurantiacus]MCX2718454.1 hypothetical protein [Lentiprolixibacter aurantiacus]
MRNTLTLVLLLLLCNLVSVSAQAKVELLADNQNSLSILGNWEIDLRPSPDAQPYLQEFQVREIEGNTFEGLFYGSPIKQSKLNRNWDRLYFAFTTSDQNHNYYHSGYLLEGKLYGLSYCPGREFVQPWTGVAK